MEKGQLLIRIQPEPCEARLRQADGNLKAQQARLAHAKSELARYTDLYRQKATSQQGHPHQGSVDFAATGADADTGTLLMRGVLPNADGKILPGQFVRVKPPPG